MQELKASEDKSSEQGKAKAKVDIYERANVRVDKIDVRSDKDEQFNNIQKVVLLLKSASIIGTKIKLQQSSHLDRSRQVCKK